MSRPMTTSKTVLAALSTGEATTPELVEVLGSTNHAIRQAITRLRNKGLIEYIACDGSGNRKWRLVSKHAAPATKVPRIVTTKPVRVRPTPTAIAPSSAVFDNSVAIRAMYEAA